MPFGTQGRVWPSIVRVATSIVSIFMRLPTLHITTQTLVNPKVGGHGLLRHDKPVNLK